ncbi:MAG: transporter [Nitrospinota bacterium]
MEFSLTFERESNVAEKVNTYSFPEPLIIFGLFPNFEVQAEASGLIIIDPDGGKTKTHGSDFTLFGKFGITSADGLIPEIAGFVGLSFPTGDDEVTSDGFDPSFIFLASWALPNGMTFAANFGFALPTNGPAESNRFFEYSTVLYLDYPITDRLVGFFEYFGSVANEGEADPHSLDAGLGYEVSQNISLEITGGAGLTEAAADFFLNFLVGISF